MRVAATVCVAGILLWSCSACIAQPFLASGEANQGLNSGNGFNGGQTNTAAGQGGGVNADFDSLIDLIIATTAPESWAENGGGEAAIRAYPNGVYADAQGLLRRVRVASKNSLAADLATARSQLSDIRTRAAMRPEVDLEDADPRAAASLRCISLGRLEAELGRCLDSGESLNEAMLTLAGLQRIRYAIFLPPTDDEPADLLLVGPAGDWQVVGDGRILSAETGQSVVRLDDLVTLLRRVWNGSPGAFGCSINPRKASLVRAQEFLNKSATRPVPPRRREAWLQKFRDAVGEQDIEVFGIAPTSRAAGVLVEADHHMKLIGMGLVDGVAGVSSYLDGLAKLPEAEVKSTGVLRWWFAMNYTAIHTSEAGDAFELVGPGAKVLSEKQLLTTRGQRVAAEADELAEQFAADFSRNFDRLCRKYPVYSELRNLFDLSLVVELARQNSEQGTASWQPALLADAQRLPLPEYEPARTVETVVNHRVVDRRRFVAGVSGGVWGDARKLLATRRQKVASEEYGPLGSRPVIRPENLAPGAWWWNLER